MGYPDLPVFLGVGRFKGYWNATTNSGTLATGPAGGYEAFDTTPLFPSGNVSQRAPNELGGYHAGTNLTATLGDFWKVTTAGSTPVDDEDAWRISDFIVYTYNSGSSSGSVWQKLSYTDTISSVIVGNGSGGSTKFGVSAADVHEFTGSIYVSGNIFAEEINNTTHNHTIINSTLHKSGSSTFGDDHRDLHQFSGSVYTGGNLAVSGTYAPHALTVHGEAGVAEYIRHLGDTNTNIRFEDDQVTLSAGGSRLIKLVEATQDQIILNDGLQDADLMHYPSSFIGAIPSIHISGSDGILHSNYGVVVQEGMLKHLGDLSGSGKILNVGGIETQGSLGVTGSVTILGAASIGGTTTITADLSSSGKILNVGGIETQGNLGVTGSMTVRNMLTHIGDMSGSGKILNVGGIETQGYLGVTGSVTVLGTTTLKNTLPATDNSFDLGSAAKRWANVYTGDLHLRNDRGDWTIVEEEDYLCVVNNKNNKRYKMMLEEIKD